MWRNSAEHVKAKGGEATEADDAKTTDAAATDEHRMLGALGCYALPTMMTPLSAALAAADNHRTPLPAARFLGASSASASSASAVQSVDGSEGVPAAHAEASSATGGGGDATMGEAGAEGGGQAKNASTKGGDGSGDNVEEREATGGEEKKTPGNEDRENVTNVATVYRALADAPVPSTIVSCMIHVLTCEKLSLFCTAQQKSAITAGSFNTGASEHQQQRGLLASAVESKDAQQVVLDLFNYFYPQPQTVLASPTDQLEQMVSFGRNGEGNMFYTSRDRCTINSITMLRSTTTTAVSRNAIGKMCISGCAAATVAAGFLRKMAQHYNHGNDEELRAVLQHWTTESSVNVHEAATQLHRVLRTESAVSSPLLDGLRAVFESSKAKFLEMYCTSQSFYKVKPLLL